VCCGFLSPLKIHHLGRVWTRKLWVSGKHTNHYTTKATGQSGTGTGFSLNSLIFPCQHHSTAALYACIIWRMKSCSLVAAVLRYSLIPSTWTCSLRTLNIFQYFLWK
jgi:hypothetical protein